MFACVFDCCVCTVFVLRVWRKPLSLSLTLSLALSTEMKWNSWSGPSERVRGRRNAWGGSASRSSRIWSWLSLSAGSTCPEREASPQSLVQSPTLYCSHPKYRFLPRVKNNRTQGPLKSSLSSVPLSFEARITQLFFLLLKLHSVLRRLSHRRTKALMDASQVLIKPCCNTNYRTIYQRLYELNKDPYLIIYL